MAGWNVLFVAEVLNALATATLLAIKGISSTQRFKTCRHSTKPFPCPEDGRASPVKPS
jgi:hypothetical protein